MVWEIAAATGISALGSIFGANEQADAVSDAERAQTQAANRQIDLQERIYEDQRQLQQPFYQLGLQGMYGPSGLSNLLGITQPATGGGSPQTQQTAVSQPQNAFSQYASGTYGAQTPAQQEDDKWQRYLDANQDVLNAFNTQNLANSPHLLGGGGKGTDTNGDGVISPTEFAAYHYRTHGQSEGRGFGEEPANAFSQPASGGGTPSVVSVGNGAYMPSNSDEVQPLTASPATSQPIGKEVSEPEGPMTQTLRATPGYQFLQDESKRQIENSFASRGKLLSGSAMDALNARTLGLADQTYQQSVNNNFNLANLGMGSAAQISNSGTNYANATSNAYSNIGNAQAQGAYGQANAFNSGLQGVSDSIFGGLGIYGGQQGWF